MSELVARRGRHQQRYDDGYRLVAGCIPYRYLRADDECNGNLEQTIEVLMITSESGPGLIFPKGGWETDESVEEAARREALEEAGVGGEEIKEIPGIWEFKSKSPENQYNPEGLCRAQMFALCVTEQLDSWPEEDTHQRQWLSVEDALQKCRHEWMKRALEKCVLMLGTSTSSESVASVNTNGSSQLTDQEQSFTS